MTFRVEGVALPLGDLKVMPGLVNAHDHLEFALFPRLGSGPYANAKEWALDIYHPDQSPIREHLSVPKSLRLLWGGLRNLLAGVTTVAHHNPYEPVFDQHFPCRVAKHYGWAHSFGFENDIAARARSTPSGDPFFIHLGEGTDETSANEIFELHRIGALDDRTVLIHTVGLTGAGWQLAGQARASVVWCPQSNLFTLGRTLTLGSLPPAIRVALGTDSPLTSAGDLLDELRTAASLMNCPIDELRPMVTTTALDILRLAPAPDWIAVPAFGEPPELVVIDERVLLASPRLSNHLPAAILSEFHLIEIEGRPPVLVRWNIPQLTASTVEHLGGLPLTLGGRRILQ